MKSKTKTSEMLNPMKFMAIILSLFFTIFLVQSCTKDLANTTESERFLEESGIRSQVSNGQEEEEEFGGVDCDGKKILVFNSLAELQQEHLNLYDQYVNANEDEQILINYEINNNFYSLRKKEHQMDDGIIPYEPDFDETEYTFDAVFETMLNQDGMIIIEDRLYLWSSGCVIHSVPFSCDNYLSLLEFRDAALNGDEQYMHDLYYQLEMININICDELQYDFEYVSGNGGFVDDKDLPPVKSKNGCGYSVFLNKNLVSCENGRYIFEISYESIEPLGTTSSLDNYWVTAVFGDLDDLQFGTALGQLGSFPVVVQGQTYGYALPYFGTFYMSTPQTAGMQVIVALSSAINVLSGNSCPAYDEMNINISCPVGIVADKIDVNESTATWSFTFDYGDASCGNDITGISWDFGDGNTGTGITEIHEYDQLCLEEEITITAIVSGTICGQQVAEQAYTYTISLGGAGACNRRTYKFPTYKLKVDGKRLKLAAKIKKRNSKTIFKNKFKWRKIGDKTITSSGNVYAPTPNNSGPCNIIDIASLVPPKTKSGKSRNKQKVKVYSINQISALDPYEVKFTHSNGFSHTLTASDLYCSQ